MPRRLRFPCGSLDLPFCGRAANLLVTRRYINAFKSITILPPKGIKLWHSPRLSYISFLAIIGCLCDVCSASHLITVLICLDLGERHGVHIGLSSFCSPRVITSILFYSFRQILVRHENTFDILVMLKVRIMIQLSASSREVWPALNLHERPRWPNSSKVASPGSRN